MTFFSLLLCFWCVATVCFSAVPIPTQSQLLYQSRGITALIHFNMATFFRDGDPGCNAANWNKSGDPKSFNPTNLNISNWVEHFNALHIKSAVLTAKHGCGFLLWPTNVHFENGSPYTYDVNYSSYSGDVLREFVTTLHAAGIGTGFYYSLTNNFYLNVAKNKVQPNPLPKQVQVTQGEFESIIAAHLTELFTQYGNYSEFWFDGGEFDDVPFVSFMLEKYQSSTVVFNGAPVTQNAIKWVGTESGMPGKDVWSNGCSDTGDPKGTRFCATGCDTTLQEYDRWFWSPGVQPRPMSELIKVYHQTVGNNCVMELDFAIDRTGNVDPNHSKRYFEFAKWIDDCYGMPLAMTNGVMTNSSSSIMLKLPASLTGKKIDRVMIQEDLRSGQKVVGHSVSFVDGGKNVPFLENQGAVGFKKIHVAKNSVTVGNGSSFVLKVTSALEYPVTVMKFAVFGPCSSS